MILSILFFVQLAAASPATHIFGGSEVDPTSLIAQSTVMVGGCSGVLIAPDIALTAGHCTGNSGEPITVQFGVDGSVATRIGIICANENADQNFGDKNISDIAIVYFGGGLPNGFVPAVVASPKLEVKNGQVMTLAGYGTSFPTKDGIGAGTLRSIQLPVADAAYSPSEVTFGSTAFGGICYGDSGGPAYVSTTGTQPTVFALTSRTVGDTCYDPAVYTKVSAFADWIQSKETILRARHVCK